MLASLEGVAPDEVAIGARVRAVFERVNEDLAGPIQAGGVVSTYGVSVLGADLATLLETAEATDLAGFDAAWASEFYSRSGSISMAAMAARTKRCRIGSSILYASGAARSCSPPRRVTSTSFQAGASCSGSATAHAA